MQGISMITTQQLEWAAGFMEAEGCFHHSKRQIIIAAAQVKEGPLEKLQAMFGGHLYVKNQKNGNKNKCQVWQETNQRAAEISMTLFCLLSPKRQTEIKLALDRWKTTRNKRYVHACPQGHSLSGDNLYTHNNKRYCLQCRSYEEHIRRGWRKPQWQNRHSGEKQNFQCKRGHALTEENLYYWNGKRYCKECRVFKRREYYLTHKAAI